MDRTIEGQKDTLRRLTLNDERFVRDMLGRDAQRATDGRLDANLEALVRLAALIAVDAGPCVIDAAVTAALAAGASPGDVVDVLLMVAPCVGSARVVGAAPHVAQALGYDVMGALERLDPLPERRM